MKWHFHGGEKKSIHKNRKLNYIDCGVNIIQIHNCNIASKIGNRNSRHRVFVLRFNAYLHIRYYLFNSDY